MPSCLRDLVKNAKRHSHSRQAPDFKECPTPALINSKVSGRPHGPWAPGLVPHPASKGMDNTRYGLENDCFTMRSALHQENFKNQFEGDDAEHSTPQKCAGHAGAGSLSMRTHSGPAKTTGHAGDGLASMCMHCTPVKSAEHDGDGLTQHQYKHRFVVSLLSGKYGLPL